MNDVQAVGSSGAAEGPNTQQELRRLSREFEAVFLRELIRSMRATVPEGGLLDSSTSQELFTSLLDDQLASDAAQRLRGGIGDALFNQLRRVLAEGDHPSR